MSENNVWSYQGTEFHKCPSCDKGIPTKWAEHKGCGWVRHHKGKEQVQPRFQVSTETIEDGPSANIEIDTVDISPPEHGMIFNKTIECVLDQGKLNEIDSLYPFIYKKLKKLHLASKSE